MSDLAELLARFPRLGLAQLPTPLEPMPRLTAHLGGPHLWVKRMRMRPAWDLAATSCASWTPCWPKPWQ